MYMYSAVDACTVCPIATQTSIPHNGRHSTANPDHKDLI